MVMPALREPSTWYPFYFLLIIYILFRQGFPKGLITISALLLTVGICDFSSGKLLKKMIERPRPCHVNSEYLENVRSLVNCGSGYSMPSSHAANHFGIAFFLILIGVFKKKTWQVLLLTWAFIICLAQIYVGVHFPSDILVGVLLGYLIALMITLVLRRQSFYLPNHPNTSA